MKDFTKDPPPDIVNNIVEEAIEEVTGTRYTVRTGNQTDKGLRKEVEDVAR
jgi:hypothetical protein